ncbi:hypothetical protein NDU88_001092 [Pleurodeles waltl]|uniref:Uncharacterized protein n=1 Tax=Pleurodeles waltl TaxID=8319 RepID=A0AAV7VY14_PLEWA|nr:hypothetical protein NDU88_001092 [Pleurodeles waltl]
MKDTMLDYDEESLDEDELLDDKVPQMEKTRCWQQGVVSQTPGMFSGAHEGPWGTFGTREASGTQYCTVLLGI